MKKRVFCTYEGVGGGRLPPHFFDNRPRRVFLRRARDVDLDPFGQGGAEAAAAELGVPFLGRIPLAMAIRTASDEGMPPAAGDGPEAQAFADIAQRLLASLSGTSA